jgi:L-fuculose-phosphate aldolase
MTEEEARLTLVAAAQRTVALRLNSGTAGNLSLRHDEGMLITPSGIPPDVMRPEQIVAVDMAGKWSGRWKPSSEWAIHLGLYKATAANAVVHAHPLRGAVLPAPANPGVSLHGRGVWWRFDPLHRLCNLRQSGIGGYGCGDHGHHL